MLFANLFENCKVVLRLVGDAKGRVARNGSQSVSLCWRERASEFVGVTYKTSMMSVVRRRCFASVVNEESRRWKKGGRRKKGTRPLDLGDSQCGGVLHRNTDFIAINPTFFFLRGEADRSASGQWRIWRQGLARNQADWNVPLQAMEYGKVLAERGRADDTTLTARLPPSGRRQPRTRLLGLWFSGGKRWREI